MTLRQPLHTGESWSAELVDLDAFAQAVLDILRARQGVLNAPPRAQVKPPRRLAA